MRGLWAGLLVLAAGVLLIGAGLIIFTLVERVVPPDDDWYLVVRAPGTEGTIIGMDELRLIGNRTVEMVLLGTGEDGKPHLYTGLLLKDLAGHLNVTDYGSVTVRAADTYSKKLTRQQVTDHDVLLAMGRDGKDLAGRSDGGNGPVRLVLPQEAVGTYNAQHCVKWVSEVVFE
ncbi:MAG: molybdopterin-dependent oxidoreductase [Candidatus Thermoplasmatota archaeon]|jgi:hypothetical protein|nr:molybdopterin-dependent oxidoreductase [Candidatus Thermoplasmatota archaeon]